jgi:hypothetical protein
MRTIQKTLRAAHLENKNWKQELFLFLRNCRATPHSTTGVSPAELLFGRKLTVKITGSSPHVTIAICRYRSQKEGKDERVC